MKMLGFMKVLILVFSVNVAQAQKDFWCDQTINKLEDAKRDSNLDAIQGNYRKALNLLVSELRSIGSFSFAKGGISFEEKKVFDRGYSIGSTLLSELRTESEMRVGVVYLEAYYQMLIAVLSRSSNDDEFGRDQLSNEVNYLDSAKDQFALVNSSLTLITSRSNIVTVGPLSIYLTVLDKAVNFLRTDLETSLYVNYFQCNIDKLMELSLRIKRLKSNLNSIDNRQLMSQFKWIYDSVENILIDLNHDFFDTNLYRRDHQCR